MIFERSDFYVDSDPAEWDRASYEHHPCDDLEPLPDEASDYRISALKHLQTLKAIDVWLTTPSDARLAWLTVASTFNLTPTRGSTSAAIAARRSVLRKRHSLEAELNSRN